MVHIDDIIDAMVAVMEKRSASINKTYNVCDGEDHTQEYLMKLAAGMLGVRAPTRHAQEFMVKLLAKTRGLDSDELRFLTAERYVDVSKIGRELGWKPKVRIEQAGRELVEDFLRKGGKEIGA